ncbi:MAG: calcium/sodium antiporter [Anaerolineae bacterium]|nr:calcium/sodium antiporter [Anaerolineae bacterium]
MEAWFLDLPLSVNLVFVIIALFFVIRSSHYLIDGAVEIAHEFNVSPLVIGATVVAVGTSAAELAVNMAIVLGDGDTTAVVGNILGSNLINFGIGLGLPALIAGVILVPRDAFERDIPLYLAATGLLTAFVHDDLISRPEAAIMLIMFFIAIGLIVQYATHKQKGSVLLVEVSEIEAIAHPGAHQMTRRQALIALFGGLFVLILASRLLIFNTAAVAEALAVPEFVIGLVIIGPGTSLPEIASAIQAARRRQADLVIGMAFGSNLFNLLFGLGLPALITPLPIEETAVASFTFMDVINLSLVAILLLDFEWLGRARSINRVVGSYLAATYLGFIAYEVVKATGGTTQDWVIVMAALVGVAVIIVGLWRWRLAQIVHLAPATNRILCATRGGQASQPTHEHAIQLAQERDAELLFLYVFDQRVLQRVATPIVINEEAQIEHMLEFLRTTAQEQARQAGVRARVIVRAGRLREELVEVSREEHVSLIVLGSPAGSASRFQVAAMLDLMSEIEEATGIEVVALGGSDDQMALEQMDDAMIAGTVE